MDNIYHSMFFVSPIYCKPEKTPSENETLERKTKVRAYLLYFSSFIMFFSDVFVKPPWSAELVFICFFQSPFFLFRLDVLRFQFLFGRNFSHRIWEKIWEDDRNWGGFYCSWPALTGSRGTKNALVQNKAKDKANAAFLPLNIGLPPKETRKSSNHAFSGANLLASFQGV